ncbi:tetratricopeptide repeat protein [Candidatus Amoebophilus asiaticus]|nr:tetratricopeptide repeat protein [Candidatus Amoebophilus asiaticus]
MEYYFKSLKIKEEIRDKQGVAGSYHNIGLVLCETDSIEEGMKYLRKGLGISKELGDKQWMAIGYSSLGGWQLKLGQLGEALESGQQALELAKEVGYPDNIKRAAGLLSDVYRKMGDTPLPPLNRGDCLERALEYYELEVQMRDSIVNEEHQKATIRQEMKYEYERAEIIEAQKEKEEARIQTEAESRRNNLHYSAFVLVMVILLLSLLALGRIPFTFHSYRSYKNLQQITGGLVFLTFLLLFEFVLVLADPYIEQWTGGAPGYKLLFNALLAAMIFPMHNIAEAFLKKRLFSVKRKKARSKLVSKQANE